MQAIDNRNVSEPLVLTSWQRQVLEALREKETEKYPLSQWYLGALYALDNPYNPDCVSQAAQSLRELVEKLPEVVLGINIQSSHIKSIFETKRGDIEKYILTYKESYPRDWEGQTIDSHLANALTTLEEYLKLNEQPSRAEKIANAVTSIDPMFDLLNSQIQVEKQKQLQKLWRKLEGFAHHNSKTEAELRKCLEELEKTVFYLLAPITAEDQRKIHKILSCCSDRSANDVEQMFLLIERRGANFVFFFKHAAETADATWLPFLTERGYFAEVLWWPIHYLARIADQVPDEAIEIVRQLPETDNSWVYHEILEMALRLHGEQSVELKQEILESTNMDDDLLAYKYAGLLAHWVAENQTLAALKLSKILVEFAPNPQSEAKQERRKESSTDFDNFWETSLKPVPRIGHWAYNEIMSNGVCPLAEKEPCQVAHFLIDATANMIRLRTHQDDLNQGVDSSEIWYERFHGPDTDHEDSDKALVRTLIFACKQVYKNSPDSVMALDKALCNQQWKVFKRLRQHLYAQFPNEKTKPWIRELILEHEEYHLWEYHYEFQQMIRRACEHIGETLLSEAERTQIFDAIYSGPPEKDFREWQGEAFTKEKFLQRQRYFHRKQFKPFESVLFGKYATYFQELEAAADNDTVSDEDYLQIKTVGGFVPHRSPRSPESLAKLTDEELLAYINKWEGKKDFFEGDLWIEVSIKGLTEAFQTVFRESIIPDANRLQFWLKNREQIERPIYVRMMITGMQADAESKNFDRINEWLTFSEWVLSHPDQDDHRLSEESRENPNWRDSRRAVDDFIGACLEEEVDVPISVRGQLAKLLEMLCTQFDSWLDSGKRVLPYQDDPIAEGINNTRSSALETLVKFGFWLRRQDPDAKVSEVKTILEKRFASETEYPLTLPEYAILGRSYPWIFHLNAVWAAKHKSDFFPQEVLPKWLAAFGGFVSYNPRSESAFEILRVDFDFALRYLTKFKNGDNSEKKPTDSSGRPLKQNGPEEKLIEGLNRHLSAYYVLGLYSLKGSGEDNDRYSLLEHYYQATDNNREYWANLFNYIGRILLNTEEQLDKDLKDRIIAFFDWRLEEKEPAELQQFNFWLEAKCLEAEWRLEAYSKILEVCKPEGWSIATQVKALCEFLPDYTTKVIECFAKLSNVITDSNVYIAAENAKIILEAGFNSNNDSVRQNAERAREDLLRAGVCDLSDLVN